MQVVSVKGDTITIVYEQADRPARVGDQYRIMSASSESEGLLVQVIANEMSEDRRRIAIAKIRKQIAGEEWTSWDGWMPEEGGAVQRVPSSDVFRRLGIATRRPISVVSLEDGPVALDACRLDMINVITGTKGSGKSHLAKNILLQLAGLGIPCLVFDVNREYVNMPGAKVLRWGGNFRPDLLEVRFDILSAVIEGIHPISSDNARAIFESRGPQIYADRIEFMRESGSEPFLSLPDLINNISQFRADEMITTEIQNRLRTVDSLNLFARKPAEKLGLKQIYNEIGTQGGIIVIDLHELRDALRRTFAGAVLQHLEDICEEEQSAGTARFPFVFYEEAHFYVDEPSIINIITRGRHIGIAPIFVTNSPDKLPEAVFRQLDNMFLLQLIHHTDVVHVCKSALTDEATIDALVTRMPRFHALIVGKVTDGYPLLARIDSLPSDIAPTGKTRSAWDRFEQPAASQ